MPETSTVSANTGLRAESLAAGYDSRARPVIESVSINILPGQLTVIAGPNGSGKSTLLKALARQLEPLAGRTLLEDEDIWRLSPASYARQVAYVPQSFEIAYHLTVEELVSLGRSPHQMWWSWSASREDRAATDRALSRTGLTGLKKRYVATLSGGEKRRALIATALAQEPRYMLLDEPIANLDFQYQLSTIETMRSLRDAGIGVVAVLHDLNIIRAVADQVVLVAAGTKEPSRVFTSGPVEEVLTAPTIKSVFHVDISLIKDSESDAQYFSLIR